MSVVIVTEVDDRVVDGMKAAFNLAGMLRAFEETVGERLDTEDDILREQWEESIEMGLRCVAPDYIAVDPETSAQETSA